MTTLPIKKIAIQMKGSFIIVFLLVELIAVLNGFTARAQETSGLISAKKNNFSGFTRKQTDRGKLWMAKNKIYLGHPDARFKDKYSPDNKALNFSKKERLIPNTSSIKTLRRFFMFNGHQAPCTSKKMDNGLPLTPG